MLLNIDIDESANTLSKILIEDYELLGSACPGF